MNIGVRYYDTTALTGGHLLTMISNARKIAAYMSSEQAMKTHYPAMYRIMKVELTHRELLASREQFLNAYIENVALDLYKDRDEALLPEFVRIEVDLPIAGLLIDLKQRGLLDDVLVWWGSEFGRTPTAETKDGRDHNPEGFTMWLVGGGTKGGFSYGSTDDYGYYAAENKVHIHDLHATLLHALGLDHEHLTYRYAGRDFRLTDVEGNVVHQLFA